MRSFAKLTCEPRIEGRVDPGEEEPIAPPVGCGAESEDGTPGEVEVAAGGSPAPPADVAGGVPATGGGLSGLAAQDTGHNCPISEPFNLKNLFPIM